MESTTVWFVWDGNKETRVTNSEHAFLRHQRKLSKVIVVRFLGVMMSTFKCNICETDELGGTPQV